MLDILIRRKGKYHEPKRAKMCHPKLLTRFTSVVIRFITWALLEKTSSSSSDVSVSAFPSSLSFGEGGGGAEETTSFRTRVFANKTEFSWIISRTWRVVVAKDQSCPVTVVINQYLFACNLISKKKTFSINLERSWRKVPPHKPIPIACFLCCGQPRGIGRISAKKKLEQRRER